ncbi:N-acetyltransferase [Sphingomonas sp. RT2P30]|uniref:GNAT family N-acetyltransferase n=1 Tax=Parasphingomonas halimpatiens TaxID=3096162 RepID=UPI002FC8D55B
MISFVPLATIDPPAIEQLLDRAFGADRHGRTAYRIRAGMRPVDGLSFAALEDGALVGTIQCWPVRFAGADGRDVALAMVGPVAVDPARQRDGIGRMLMERALAAAESSGAARALMLIGDPEYYGRFFGFTAERTAGWQVPGPVERHRLLARGDDVPAGDGTIGPRLPALA